MTGLKRKNKALTRWREKTFYHCTIFEFELKLDYQLKKKTSVKYLNYIKKFISAYVVSSFENPNIVVYADKTL